MVAGAGYADASKSSLEEPSEPEPRRDPGIPDSCCPTTTSATTVTAASTPSVTDSAVPTRACPSQKTWRRTDVCQRHKWCWPALNLTTPLSPVLVKYTHTHTLCPSTPVFLSFIVSPPPCLVARPPL